MSQHPVAHVRDGAVRGKAESGIWAFLGIPYAASPFGVNRMRPPQPVRPWHGERDATAYEPTAPKGDYPPQYARLFPEVVIPGAECLNLNVWTPDTGARLPVLVWIHGGSFMNGSGSVGAYNGAAFARDGVVCVTINYRLAATIPAIRVAEARAEAASAPTWVYRFDHPDPGDNHRFGASHGAEVPFVFGTIGQHDLHPLIGDTPSQAVADQTHRAWVNFITRGDPGWPAYNTADRTTGLLSDHIEAASDPAGGERACWDRIR